MRCARHPITGSIMPVASLGGGSGGGLLPKIIINANAGSSVEVTKPDGTTILPTQAVGTTTKWECDAAQYGVYLVTVELSGISKTESVSVDTVKVYTVGAIDGRTITPVNDVATWISCSSSVVAGYTVLGEVLADEAVLYALMADDTAVDYLVRCTDWVSDITANEAAMAAIGSSDYCADTLLDDSNWRQAICESQYFKKVLYIWPPNMTSETAPKGRATGSPAFNGGETSYSAWVATGENSRGTAATASTIGYYQYEFEEPVVCNYLVFHDYGSASGMGPDRIWNSGLIQGSNDGVNYDTLRTISGQTGAEGKKYAYIFDNTKAYKIYRLGQLQCTNFSVYMQIGRSICFYGRSQSSKGSTNDRLTALETKVGSDPLDTNIGATLTGAVNALGGSTELQTIYDNTSNSTTLPTNLSLPSNWKKIIIITGIQPSLAYAYDRKIIENISNFGIYGSYADSSEFCINFILCEFSLDLSSVSFFAQRGWNVHYGATSYNTTTAGGFIKKVIVEVAT